MQILQKNYETVNEKSSQTSEMAVKLSEKRSGLALERALMPTMRRRTRDYADESPMYDGTDLTFDSPFFLIQLRICSSASARSSQHASHDSNS